MLRFFWLSLATLFSLSTHADLVILQYHHVSEQTPASTSISPADFLRHLQLLESEQMTVVDLHQAIVALQQGKTLPEKAVAITFDDAYESIYRVAFPLLKARHWPFTLFVNPDPVDRHFKGTISWDQLREMKTAGATIANHSMTHPYLLERPDGLSLDQWMQQEVGQAQQRLQAEIGDTPKMFAYPFGEYSLEMAQWLAKHEYLAFGQQSGAVGGSTHWQIIPRYPSAGGYADVKSLKEKLHTLALPVPTTEAVDPVLKGKQMPALTLTLTPDDWKISGLRCFASGEGPIKTTLTPADNGSSVNSPSGNSPTKLTAAASKPMSSGRSRYNCTVPSISQRGYFYWYSQLWINSQVKNR
jgi:peptidoglycan/xylan/chitin deacetylase (PgdA/CDA1 family)